MAESSFFGSVSPAQALNYTVTVPVSGGAGLYGNTIGEVWVWGRFSTNAYTNTYSVTCTVNYDGGSNSVTKSDIKMDATNYTGAQFWFQLASGLPAASISSIQFFGNNDASKIFATGGQEVRVYYTLNRGKTIAPTQASLSKSESDTAVTLSWSGASNGNNNPITGYHIDYQDSSNGSNWGEWNSLKDVASSSTSGSTSVNINPTFGHYRRYSVQSYGAYEGLSTDWAESGSVRFFGTWTNVQPPNSASVPALGESSATLSWSGASNGTNNSIVGYAIEYADSSDNSNWGGWASLKTVNTTSTSGNTSVAVNGSRGSYRRYRVKTLGSYANGNDYRESGAVRTNSAPTAPTSFSAAPVIYVSGTITLVYSGATDVDSNIVRHEVQYSVKLDGGSFGAWVALPHNSTTHSPSLALGSTIKYRARAVDAFGITSAYFESNTCGKNTAPSKSVISIPTAGKTTNSSTPRFLVTLGLDPEDHKQTIVADGFTASRPSAIETGGKVVLKKTIAASEGTVNIVINTADEYGEQAPEVTGSTTYAKVTLTDAKITKGDTRIKAVHINELRAMVNTMRGYYGLDLAVWVETIVSGVTKSRSWQSHVVELRAAVMDIITLVNGWDEFSTVNNIPVPQWVKITNRPSASAMEQLRTVIKSL